MDQWEVSPLPWLAPLSGTSLCCWCGAWPMLLESGSLSQSAPHSKERPAGAHTPCCRCTSFGFLQKEAHSQTHFPITDRMLNMKQACIAIALTSTVLDLRRPVSRSRSVVFPLPKRSTNLSRKNRIYNTWRSHNGYQLPWVEISWNSIQDFLCFSA